MWKLIEKNKFFIILFFSFLCLLLGSFLFLPTDAKQNSDATSSSTAYVYAKGYAWNRDSSKNATHGTYTSQDGNTYSGSVGTVTVNTGTSNVVNVRTDGNNFMGYSIGSAKGYTNTYSGNATDACFNLSNWTMAMGYNQCTHTITAVPASGFSVTSITTSGEKSYMSGCFPSELATSGLTFSSYQSKTWTLNVFAGSNKQLKSYFGHYATFAPNKYTISFDANGGTHSSSVTTKEVWFYDNYDLISDPVRSGYEFKGWFTYSSGGTQITSSTTYDVAGNDTLYAHWEPIPFVVNLNRNIASGTSDLTGGSYNKGTQTITVGYGQVYPKIPDLPSRNGYTFGGFKDSSNNVIYNSSGESSVTCNKTSTHTLFAQWTANTIAVTLNAQSGSGGTAEFYYRYDTNAYYSNASCTNSLSSITKPTRTGYTFGGYYTGTNGTGTRYVTASGAFTNTPFKKIYSNTTLYAKWTENDYTIKFDKNGGAGTMSSVSGVLYTAYQTLPSNTFTRTGYLFKGWATSAVAVDGAVVYKENQDVSKLSATDGATVTLYAVWEKTWAVDKSTPSGSGTSASPYLIANAKNLAWLAWQCETKSLSGYFKQTANINLSGETWLPIGDATYMFLGNYDGNNYVITNLTTTTTTKADGNYLYSYQGLFGYTNNATIDNVKILSGRVRGYNFVGGIVGQAKSTTIKNSQVGSVSVYANSSNNGGIAGYAYSSTFTADYSKAQMAGGSYYGGIMGYSSTSTFTACVFEGSLASTTNSYSMGRGSISTTRFYDCFAKTTTSNRFIQSSETAESCLYISGSVKKYYSGTFTNWVISTTATPLPNQISWLAMGGTKVTSLSQITALGYTQA